MDTIFTLSIKFYYQDILVFQKLRNDNIGHFKFQGNFATFLSLFERVFIESTIQSTRSNREEVIPGPRDAVHF